MSTFAEYDFEIHFRPESRNANAYYLSRSSTEVDIVLSLRLESDLNSVDKYLTSAMVKADSSNFVKAIKVRRTNYIIYDVNLYRRTVKGLRFISALDEGVVIMEGLHDSIGHLDFMTTYRIITDRFWWLRKRPEITHCVRSCDPCQKTPSQLISAVQ